ncbi:MAG: hypothetical protein DRH12_12675 [Deltaproteobacteria bacterium]|nr:MAG: hypothetical protein DRH12_12675 [Deltaproteobacteria bacterium]
MYRLVLLLGILFSVIGCSNLDIETDYNPSFDFSRLKTVAILYAKNKGETITLSQQRFADAIAHEMKEKGFKVVTDKAKADFYMVFHLDVTTTREIVTDYEMIGIYPFYPCYFGYGPPMFPVTKQYTYHEAKIILDAVDPDGNKIFWRGVATDELQSFASPQERIEYTKNVVKKLLHSFPPRASRQ